MITVRIIPQGELEQISKGLMIVECQGLYVGDFVNVHPWFGGRVCRSQVKLFSDEDFSAHDTLLYGIIMCGL